MSPSRARVAVLAAQVMSSCTSSAAQGNLHFEFCPIPARFTPIYDAAPTGNTASTNAGDYDLYVGGAAINQAFQSALHLGPNNDYQRLHELMLVEARRAPGTLASVPPGSEADTLAQGLGLLGCFARVSPGSDAAGSGPVGAVFLDVFAPRQRPLSGKNVAMLYAVGPRGAGQGPAGDSAGRMAFLNAVGDVGGNALLAVGAYNALAESGGALPTIDVLQWCLVSGGLYRHPGATKLDVAEATVRGMTSAGQASATGVLPTVRFAYDEGVFQAAVQQAAAA